MKEVITGRRWANGFGLNLQTTADVSIHHLSLTTMVSMSSFRADFPWVLGLHRAASSMTPTVTVKPLLPSSTPAPRSRGPNENDSGHRRSLWRSAALLLPPALAALLGKWQLDRRQWKIDMLNRRQTMLAMPPLDISLSDSEPKWTELDEYTPVTASGQYDEDRTQFVGPRPRSQMGTTEVGYLVVTPLVLPSKQGQGRHSPRTSTSTYSEVLVLRGWAPAGWKDAISDKNHLNPTSIQGVVRRGEDPGTFVPPNSPEQKTFYYVNPGELAMAAGLPETTPLIEIITPEKSPHLVRSGGPPTAMEVLGGRGTHLGRPAIEKHYPLAKSVGDLMAFSVMPRDHANYAATWFTLSSATTLLAVRVLRRARR
jgi:surfeit locus 1 family protein